MAVARTSSPKAWPHSLKVLFVVAVGVKAVEDDGEPGGGVGDQSNSRHREDCPRPSRRLSLRWGAES